MTLAGIGGLYNSFACSVMPGLRATEDGTFVSAMASINAAIQNPAFAVAFFGAFFSLTGAAVYSFANGLESAFPVSLAWAFYTATLVNTFAVNIPLNNGLAQAAVPGQDGARKAYEQKWTRWNLHRTWLSLASLVALCAG